MQVEISKSAEKELNTLEREIQDRVFELIEKLYPASQLILGYKKIKGSKSLYRYRIGEYKIVFKLSSKIDILRIRHRKEAYRNIENLYNP